MDIAPFFEIWKRREVLTIVALGVASVFLWRVPLIGWLFYPFRLFNTFVHELSHGLAALLTGGAFQRFVVHPNRFGMAWVAGGARWIVVSAGYLGCALFGGILTILTASDVPARSVLVWLGMILALLCLFFVRNIFGILAGFVLAALLYIAGWQLEEASARSLLLLLAVQMMLSALDSIFDLVRISADSRAVALRSDAQVMAERTGIPAIIWALLWSLVAVGILLVSLTLAYGGDPLLGWFG